ncbi:hypothetical protein FRC09_011446 [Ceratobasidium sp. 395]|nr:hypothetical protein FRC09_011446 [Ceratobasidium sp. 395]
MSYRPTHGEKSLEEIGETFKVLGWKVLVARARQKVLLRNLHTLVIKTTSDTDGPNQPMWIGTFSSPSLVNLLITDGNLWGGPIVSYPAASFAMKSLAAHRPKLERLELLPCSEVGDYVDEAESNLLAFLSGDPFYKYAAHFTDLKHLSCTFAWLEGPALQTLGQLPHLEAIEVYGVDELDETSPELPEDSFPSLHSLYLHLPDPSDAMRTMMITQMVKGLTSLHITLDIGGLTNALIDEQRWLMEVFFPLLLNVPHVTDLWIDADPNDQLDDDVEIDGSVLDIFHQLPLNSLHLGQIRMSDEDLQSNLAWVWPSIGRLSMPRQPVSFTLLSLFTQLHGLRHLELQLDLDEIFHEYDKTVSVLTVLQAIPGSTLCSNFEQADQVMRALLKNFPKLAYINWPSDHESAYVGPNSMHEDKYEHVSCMNGHRAALVKIFALEKSRQLQPIP